MSDHEAATHRGPEADWPLFSLGIIVATPGAMLAIGEAQVATADFINRHVTGDWGDVDEDDRKENEFSLKHGFRLLSAYTLPTEARLWIITEADRSVTTLLLPEEY